SYQGHEKVQQWKAWLTESGHEWTERGIIKLWEEKQWKNSTLSQLVPGWDEEQRLYWTKKATDTIVSALLEELNSLRGSRLIQQMTSQMLEQVGGGFLGTLAGM